MSKRNYLPEEWENIKLLVDSFEEIVASNDQPFFDVKEFETIIDFFMFRLNYKKCEEAIKHALKLYPNNTVFLFQKAELFSQCSREHQALEILKYLEKIEPQNTEVYIKKGSLYHHYKEYEKAIKEYFKAIKTVSNELEVSNIYVDIAEEYIYIDDIENSFEYIHKSIKLNPDNESVLRITNFICNAEDEEYLNYTVDVLHDFLEEFPFSLPLWIALGNVYEILEHYFKAIEAYDYAIAINPSHMLPYLNKAQVFSNLEDYNNAIKVYKQMLALEEKPDCWILNLIGECYEKLNKPGTARKYFTKATETDSLDYESWINLGFNYLNNDEPQKALDCMEEALQTVPAEFPDILFIKAKAFTYLKRYEEAFPQFELLLAVKDKNPDVWIDYADAVEEYKGTNAAIKILERGIKKFPDYAALQYRISACKFKSGKQSQGLLCLYNAMSKDFSGMDVFFKYMPELKNSKNILKLIELVHKNIKH